MVEIGNSISLDYFLKTNILSRNVANKILKSKRYILKTKKEKK